MNLPNKLTVIRICMIPLFLIFFFFSTIPNSYLYALIVFAAASVTDMLDGMIARKYNLITDFGKLMDPLADKLLVISAILCLMDIGMVHTIVVILIISREFMVTSLRLLAAPKGIVLAADIFGKYKTVSQMLWVCVSLLLLWAERQLGVVIPGAEIVNLVLILIVTVLTVGSGINYMYKNRNLLKDM